MHRTHYLHGYHGVVPPMALFAPLAQVARSTNRSTTHHSERLTSTTERYHAQRAIRRYAANINSAPIGMLAVQI